MENLEQKEQWPNEVKVIRPSREEAIALVKEFWGAMSHGAEFVRASTTEVDFNWAQELTQGDRTLISRVPREGGWRITIKGNHQPLSSEAVAWLKEKGLMIFQFRSDII